MAGVNVKNCVLNISVEGYSAVVQDVEFLAKYLLQGERTVSPVDVVCARCRYAGMIAVFEQQVSVPSDRTVHAVH